MNSKRTRNIRAKIKKNEIKRMKIQKIQKKIFDLFLRTNGQMKGINSYNEVVTLLLFTFDGKNKFIFDENN